MVQLAFFLRFKLQLQRTRPNLVPRLEDMAAKAVREAGGELAGGGGAIRAAFDENSPGFWLDMLLLVERLARIVEGAETDLHGHSVLLGEAMPSGSERLCRVLSGGFHGGGVYLDEKAAAALRPYVTVEEQGKWEGVAFFKLKEEKIFVPTARTGFLLPEKNVRLFEPGRRPSVLVSGRLFEGKRDNLYRRVAGFSGQDAAAEPLPPLFVRFGSGGLNAIADAWPSWIGEDDADPKTLAKMAAMREFLFRHRLRVEPSHFAAGMAREFFGELLAIYGSCAARKGMQPVAILENIGAAEPAAADIAIETLAARKDFVFAGLLSGEIGKAESAKWDALFPRKLKATDKGEPRGQAPELPPDLWEMGYACALLGRIFPPDLIPGALGEMGKNPGMISRSVSLLHALRVIDTPLDPRPWREDFAAMAEAALAGEKKSRLRALVRERLLAWVAKKRLAPCASLLERLAELGGGETDDALVLQAVHGELGCADGAALERLADRAEAAVGEGRAGALRYAARALLALHYGGERKIREAFASEPPECPAHPLLKAQALLCQSLYHLGWHDGGAATKAAKAATLLCQKSGSSWLSRCHRLFALASLSERRIGETNEYLGFALENAIKSGDPQEIGLSSYYTAAVQLLHGNLSRARTLAGKALGNFLEAGSPEWADRSRFLEGRIAFENGGYAEAALAFEGVRDRPHGGGMREKIGLMDAWAYRAATYAARSPAPRPKDRVPDADLFELEALYFGADYPRLARLSGKLAAAPPKDELFYGTEQPDWRSGFAQCELLFFSWHDFRSRMLGAYRSIAQSHLSPREGKMAVHSMQQILQNNRFAEIDPCDTFYHYAHYEILSQTGAGQIDLRTTASMARKRMQIRSGRIDSPETRRQYLTQPYWNKALEEAARELKLV